MLIGCQYLVSILIGNKTVLPPACPFVGIVDDDSLLRHRQNGCHLADAIFLRIFLKENVCNLIKTYLKFVPKGLIGDMSSLV